MTDRAYARISLDTAASGSIAKQRSALLGYAPDAVVYTDESVSGSKVPFAQRPAGARLLADLQKGDRVLVTKIDRAARNVRDLLTLVERIEEAGATIRFLGNDIDTSGPSGRFMLTLLGAVAEMEAALISERRTESLKAFRNEGRHAVGKPPFGLQSVPNPEGRGLVLRPHPDEAPLMREAVERILAGETHAAVAADLGIGATMLSRLLRNDRLAGVLDPKAAEPRIDPAQAVFTVVEWQALREHLDGEVKTWAKAEGIGGALACGVCGDRLYVQRAANPAHTTYKCRGVRHVPGGPGRVAVVKANADMLVEEQFLGMLGWMPMTEVITVASSEARDAAIARARFLMDAARRAQDAATTEDAEDEADRAYRAARRALREAEAMPSESTTTQRPTGETFREVWERSDDDERTALLLNVGPWTVRPGRLPLADKVVLEGVGAAWGPLGGV